MPCTSNAGGISKAYGCQSSFGLMSRLIIVFDSWALIALGSTRSWSNEPASLGIAEDVINEPENKQQYHVY
jgi:hypothetical protein